MSRTDTSLKHRAEEIRVRLGKAYPDAKCSLHYQSPHELLVATILSAQCTDERVNKVTPGLFRKYPSVEALAYADIHELASDIHSCGYHNQKARNIIGACLKIVEEYEGRVPDNMADLLTLPGVGRKTANCVLGECFSVPAMVIDTHMIRIMNLLGLSSSHDPKKIELELMDLFDPENWVSLTHRIIDHGRKVCIARRPQCQICFLRDLCPSSP
ncbi:MAG: endonuclease III [Fidelibacterota bacterium]